MWEAYHDPRVTDIVVSESSGTARIVEEKPAQCANGSPRSRSRSKRGPDPACRRSSASRASTKSYDVDGSTVTALDGVDLEITAGEIFAVIGQSGAGKSTLVRLINGLERVTSGTVVVDGVDISTLPERQVRPIRRRTGMIFQQFNLFASRTVAGNVIYPLKVAGWSKADREKRAAELLDFVGLLDRAHALPRPALGGSEAARRYRSRSRDLSPILLADESTSALDPATTADVLDLLRRSIANWVSRWSSSRTRWTSSDRSPTGWPSSAPGRIVETGTAFDVFAEPTSETVGRSSRRRSTTARVRTTSRALREAHPGRIVIADVVDGAGIGGILSRAAGAGVTFELLYGGISSLQQRSFGSLTVELTGSDESVDAVIAQLRAVTRVEEVAR